MKPEQYKIIAETVLADYINKYKLKIIPLEAGIQIENSKIVFLIGYKYQEFEMILKNRERKIYLIDLILLKYPDYLITNFNIFDLSKLTKNEDKDFAYYIKTSFEFIDKNSPQVFTGDFSIIK